MLIKLAAIDFIDDKEGKPIGIQRHIGRRPIASFGNSDCDLQMLQWTTAGSGARFALIVHHTDADREWAYDRKSHIGMLDKAWDAAVAKGWTVVNRRARTRSAWSGSPAGEFVMGTDDEQQPVNERPAHRVRLDGFWMDRHSGHRRGFAPFVPATATSRRRAEGRLRSTPGRR